MLKMPEDCISFDMGQKHKQSSNPSPLSVGLHELLLYRAGTSQSAEEEGKYISKGH